MKQHGFTLLEIMVALAIVGLALGTIFGVLSGSKRLAFTAAQSIDHTLFFRSGINAAQVEEKPKYPQLPETYAEKTHLNSGELLEKPPRETVKMLYALEPYTFKAENGKELSSLRWKKLETAR